MKITDIYGWGLPRLNEFFRDFSNNDNLYTQARSLWKGLDSCTVWFIIAFVVLALLFAVIYYGPYNNKPGRHYKINRWALWLLITGIATFAVTFIFSLIMVHSPLLVKYGLFLRISVVNALYSIAVYLILSFIVCNASFIKTNAYRFLKIGK